MDKITSNTLHKPFEIPGKGPVFLAIGMFDGVHIGHQAVLESCIHAARLHRGRAGVYTFFPHPSRLFYPKDPVLLIQSPELKEIALSRLGVDFLIKQNFDLPFSSIEAEEFPRLLKKAIPGLHSVYVGRNWRFGHGRRGDIHMLTRSFQELGVTVVSLERVERNGVRVSSTRIRDLLALGKIEEVNELLGYRYFSQGKVVAGKRLGRDIGFPTLNLPWAPEMTPRYGVYQVELTLKGDEEVKWKAIANYGVRPTVDEMRTSPLLEVHLLEQRGTGTVLPDTGSEIIVEWLRFVRPERRFNSIEELKTQIQKDVRQVQSW